MKKKVLSLLLLSAVLVTMISGCGASQTDREASETIVENAQNAQQSGTVKLSVWAEENNFDMLNQMIDSFKQKYAGQADFEIELIVQGDGTAKDAALADIHNMADVITMPDDQLLGFIAAGAIEVVPNAEEIKKANLPDAVAAASYNDILYAYPCTADNGYFLYYDKNYFTEEDVKSMDRILEVAEEAGKKVSMEFNSGWYLYSFFGGTGLDFGLNDDGVTNHCNWNTTEGSIKGVDVAQALLDICASPAFAPQADGSFVEGAQAGEVIAGISGVWNAVAIKEIWGSDYGACKLPTYTCAGKQIQMSSFKGYKMIGVNAYSENKEWAHKFADWITNEENQNLRFELRNQGPSNINAAASEEVKKVPAILAVIEQSEYGSLQRVGNSYWGACTSFADTIAAGNPDQIPLQELMDKMVKGITASSVQ